MQQLISHLLIICDNVYKENAFAVYDPNLFQFCTYSAGQGSRVAGQGFQNCGSP